MQKMQKKIEWIAVTAVVYSTEDMKKVGEAIATIFPFEFDVKMTDVKGHYGNPMKFLEVEVERKKLKEFWNNLMELIGEQRKFLLNAIEEKLDEHNVLHIRINKQKAYLGEIELGDRDAIVIKVKIVTFPAKRENVLDAVRELMEYGVS